MTRFCLEAREGLCLVDRFSLQQPLRVDFVGGGYGYRLRRGGGRQEMLAKAVGAKPGLKVVDATAGHGRDAFLLAHLGCEVVLLERSPVIAALLRDGLERALAHEDTAEAAARMRLLQVEAVHHLAHSDEAPGVIVLDPMFPSRTKSALVKGEMQMLQRFLGTDEDTDALLEAALASGAGRVVVKRPLKAPVNYGKKPSYDLRGRSSRFDVFVQ